MKKPKQKTFSFTIGMETNLWESAGQVSVKYAHRKSRPDGELLGKSSWIDYTNPEAQQYWAEQYQYDKFIVSRDHKQETYVN